MDDSNKAEWRPEWQRKQKRTTKDLPPPVVTPPDFNEQIKSMLPSKALVRKSEPLDYQEFIQLLEALEFYALTDPKSASAEEFIVRHTKLEPKYISNYLQNRKEKDKENPLFQAAESLASRARLIFECNISRVHTFTNAQFAQFMLISRHGYQPIKDAGGNVTNIAIDARSFLQQLGKLPETVVDSKHLPDNNNPTDTPKAIN